MKTVFKEWARCPIAVALLACNFLMCCVYNIIDTKFTVSLPRVMGSGDITRGTILLASLIILQSIMGILINTTGKRSVYYCYNAMDKRFGDKVLSADYELFTKFSVAKITTLSGFMDDITSVMRGCVRMVDSLIVFVTNIVGLYILSAKLVLPVVIVYIVGGVVMWGIYKSLNKYDEAKVKAMKHRNQLRENMINGFAEIRTFSVIDSRRSDYYQAADDVMNTLSDRLKSIIRISVASNIIETIGLVLAILFGLFQIKNRTLTAAEAVSLVMLISKLMNPLLNILDWADDLSSQLAMSKDYSEFIEYENKMHDGNVNLNFFQSSIEIEDVCFSYNDSSSVLNHLTLSIPKGSRIGICGKTGDGKSTVLKLLNRFYDPTSGKIAVDGINLKDISLDSYRKNIGSVQQETVIFPGSIKENILFAKPGATEYEVVEACKKAKIYDFVKKLPDGLNTEVGPRGLKLSGGQKQRISLARLFLVDPEIILLDEATSALDNETETLIQDAIDELQGKTIITIAHRLSTIKNSDKIVVMENGHIAEAGTHEELVEKKGIYFTMLK